MNTNLVIPKINMVFIILLIFGVGIGFLTPFFWTADNVVNIFSQASIPMLLTFALCFVIGSGQIDLSIGSAVAVTGIAFGLLANATNNIFFSIICTTIFGASLGLLNGYISIYIPSFIATLGTMACFRGLALAITNAQSINIGAEYFEPSYGGVSIFFLIALFIGLSSYTIFRFSWFGLAILAIGSNRIAATNYIKQVNWYCVSTFVISGALSGLAGAFLTIRLGAARPTAGEGYELDAIAATIVGGALLTGGKVNVWGAAAATLLFSLIRNSLTLLNISPSVQQISVGIVLIVVVLSQLAELRSALDKRGG